MLTLAVRQLQELGKIESLLITQGDITMPMMKKQHSMIPTTYCRRLLPINGTSVFRGPFIDERTNSSGRLDFRFNFTPMRSAGGADHPKAPVMWNKKRESVQNSTRVSEKYSSTGDTMPKPDGTTEVSQAS